MKAEVVSKTGAAFGERSADRLTHRNGYRTHFMTNLLSNIPRRAQPWVATMVRTITCNPLPRK